MVTGESIKGRDDWVGGDTVIIECDNENEAQVKTTRYFEEQVLRKRPYIRREWCENILAHPLRKEIQQDGRIRFWGAIGELEGRVLRVVTLADGETVHNAFPDRNFVQEENR